MIKLLNNLGENSQKNPLNMRHFGWGGGAYRSQLTLNIKCHSSCLDVCYADCENNNFQCKISNQFALIYNKLIMKNKNHLETSGNFSLLDSS